MSKKILHICLGNQLFPIKHLKNHNIERVYMREDMQLCTFQKHHKHKIILFLSAMRSYRDLLKKNKIDLINGWASIKEPGLLIVNKLIFYETSTRFYYKYSQSLENMILEIIQSNQKILIIFI